MICRKCVIIGIFEVIDRLPVVGSVEENRQDGKRTTIKEIFEIPLEREQEDRSVYDYELFEIVRIVETLEEDGAWYCRGGCEKSSFVAILKQTRTVNGMENEKSLKPCPFCGGEARYSYTICEAYDRELEDYVDVEQVAAGCPHCNIGTFYQRCDRGNFGKETVTELWNTRQGEEK